MNSKNATMEDKTAPLAYEAPEIRELLIGLVYGEGEGEMLRSGGDIGFCADGEDGGENGTFSLDE